jgi:hypothetical protein
MNVRKRILILWLGVVFTSCVNSSYASDAAEEEGKADPTILLESTFVGDKEQPAVSYFIPWKGNGTPDKLQWNMENKHDQTLQIIDRDVLLNSMNIYNEMNLESNSAD